MRACAFPPYDPSVVPEASLEESEHALIPKDDG
jgi:hypothetical protein